MSIVPKQCIEIYSGTPLVIIIIINTIPQSLTEAYCMIYSSRRSEHITPLLHELHWLKVPQRIQFRLCVLTYRCLHGTVPAYLSDSLHSVADIDARRRLRSADTSTLLVPTTWCSTVGDRAFPVAAARAWNALPVTVRGVSTLSAFCRKLKTHFYRCTFD